MATGERGANPPMLPRRQDAGSVHAPPAHRARDIQKNPYLAVELPAEEFHGPAGRTSGPAPGPPTPCSGTPPGNTSQAPPALPTRSRLSKSSHDPAEVPGCRLSNTGSSWQPCTQPQLQAQQPARFLPIERENPIPREQLPVVTNRPC